VTDAFVSISDALQGVMDSLRDGLKGILGESAYMGTLLTEQQSYAGALPELKSKTSFVGAYDKEKGSFADVEDSTNLIDGVKRYFEIEVELYNMRLAKIEKERGIQQALFDKTREMEDSLKETFKETIDAAKEFGLSIFDAIKGIKKENATAAMSAPIARQKYALEKNYTSAGAGTLTELMSRAATSDKRTAKATFTSSSASFKAAEKTFVAVMPAQQQRRLDLEGVKVRNEGEDNKLAVVSTTGYTKAILAVDDAMSKSTTTYTDARDAVMAAATEYKDAIEAERSAKVSGLQAGLEFELTAIDKRKDAEMKLFDKQFEQFNSLKGLLDRTTASIEDFKKKLDPTYQMKALAEVTPFVKSLTSKGLQEGIKAGKLTKDDIAKIEKYHDLTVETVNMQVDAMKQLFDTTKQMNDWLNNLVFSEYSNTNTATKMNTAKTDYDRTMALTKSDDPAVRSEALKMLTGSADQYLKQMTDYYSNLYDTDPGRAAKEAQLSTAKANYDTTYKIATTSTNAEEKNAAQQSLTGLSEQYLKILQEFYASGTEYTTKYDEITSAVQGVVDANKDTLGITKDNAPMLTAENTAAIRGLQSDAVTTLGSVEQLLKGVSEVTITDEQMTALRDGIDARYAAEKIDAGERTDKQIIAINLAAMDELRGLGDVVTGGNRTEQELKTANLTLGGLSATASSQYLLLHERSLIPFNDDPFATEIKALSAKTNEILSQGQIDVKMLEEVNQKDMKDTLVKQFGEQILATREVKTAVENVAKAVNLAAADIAGSAAAKLRADAITTQQRAIVSGAPATAKGIAAAYSAPTPAPTLTNATPAPAPKPAAPPVKYDGNRFGVDVNKNEINGTGATLLNGQLPTAKHDNINNGYSPEMSRLASAHARARVSEYYRAQGKSTDGSDAVVNKAINDASNIAGNNVVRDTLDNLRAQGVDLSNGKGKLYAGDDWGKHTKLSGDLLRAKAKVEYKDNAIMQGIAGYKESSVFDYDPATGRALEKGTGRAVYNMVERADNTRDTLYFDQLDKLPQPDRDAIIKAWKAKNANETLRLYPFAKGGFVTKPTFGLLGEAGNEVVLPEDTYRKLTDTPIKDLGIPMLATGGIVSNPTLAMIGEGQEAEAVLPLSKLEELINRGAEERPIQPQAPRQTVVVIQAANDSDGNDEKELEEMREQTARLREQNALLREILARMDENNAIAADQTDAIERTSKDVVVAIKSKSSASSAYGR